MELTLIASILLIATLNSNNAARVCHVFQNRCIFINYSGGMENFATSSANCEFEGGKLITITDFDTNTFILDFIKREFQPGYKLWIGLKMNHLQKWQYTDDRQLNITNFQNWAPTYTAAHLYKGYQCATIDVSLGLWHVASCYYSYLGICEVPVSRCHTLDIQIPNAQLDSCMVSALLNPGANVTIKCKDGFILQGSSSIFCAANGWSTFPTCIPGCLLPELPSNVKIFNPKPHYEIGEKLMVYCEHGYLAVDKYMRSHQLVECTSGGGNWPSLKKYCIPDQQLKCQDKTCTEVQISAKENVKLTLKCPLDVNGVVYPYYRWLKNHESLNFSESEHIANETDVIISRLTAIATGIYSCLRGKNENYIENVIIYIVTLSKNCPESTIQNLPTITVNEDESFYLSSKNTGEKTDVKWFKDDNRLIDTNNVRLLPNGDVMIKKATYNDQGLYSYQIQSAVSNCYDTYVWDVYVNVKAESICGETDTENNQPWVVALSSQQEITPFCYGTLISDYWIISSAFCVSKYYRRLKTDVVAQFRLYVEQPDDEMQNFTWNIPIEHFVVHQQYSDRLGVNDIGLAKLKDSVSFSTSFKPICLSNLDFQNEHERLCLRGPFSGLVSGWGSVEGLRSGKMGPILFENMTVATKELCQKYTSFQFPDKMFCARRDVSVTSTNIVGDSGSPFLVKYNGRFYLQGVFSWGERQAQVGNYDFFTKVGSYNEWIKTTMEMY